MISSEEPSPSQNPSNPARWLWTEGARRGLPLLLLLGLAAVYTGYWSWVDWLRLTTYHLPVYDFGVSYQAVWAAAHGSSIDVAGPSYTNSILYLFVLPYFLSGSQQNFQVFLLVFQNAWLALGAVPIYLLCVDKLQNRWVGLVLGLVFILYPASNGIVYFPFHFEGLFPTLFLFGYLLYRRKHLYGAAAVFALSSLTEVGALAVLLFFALGIVCDPLLARLRARFRKTNVARPVRLEPARIWFAVFLVLEVVVLFVVFVVIGGFENITSFAFHTANGGLSQTTAAAVMLGGISANWTNKLLTLALLFLPVLALPVFAREERWALLPYVALMLLAQSFGIFLFPFKDQYPSLLIGPLFASVVRGLERFRTMVPKPSAEGKPTPSHRIFRLHRPTTRTFALSCLAVSAIVALVFAPWGPFNDSLAANSVLEGGDYHLDDLTTGNATVDVHLADLISRIPSDGWLLVQNNLPQAVDRQEYLVPGFYDFNVPLQYLVTDPYEGSFYPGTNFGPYNTSMMYWADYYLQHGWTVLGEANGALLLSESPGATSLYYPLTQTFSRGAFSCCFLGGSAGNLSNFTGFLVTGPQLPVEEAYSVFSPGSYEIQLQLGVNRPSALGSVNLIVAGSGGQVPLLNSTYAAGAWSTRTGTVTIDENITFAAYYPRMYFGVYLSHWDGPVSFQGLELNQTAPA